jgi:hypothetical protein
MEMPPTTNPILTRLAWQRFFEAVQIEHPPMIDDLQRRGLDAFRALIRQRTPAKLGVRTKATAEERLATAPTLRLTDWDFINEENGRSERRVKNALAAWARAHGFDSAGKEFYDIALEMLLEMASGGEPVWWAPKTDTAARMAKTESVGMLLPFTARLVLPLPHPGESEDAYVRRACKAADAQLRPQAKDLWLRARCIDDHSVDGDDIPSLGDFRAFVRNRLLGVSRDALAMERRINSTTMFRHLDGVRESLGLPRRSVGRVPKSR